MADIFISYSSEDRDRVISIVKVLEEQGWSAFWDWRSIPVGKTWRQFIEEGLIEASCVLVLWSKKSIVSEWVLEEADYGKSNGMLIPARMDDILPPFGFRQIQAANLINWTGDKINPEFNELLVALEAIIGPSPKHVQEAERDRKEAGKKGFRKLARLGEKISWEDAQDFIYKLNEMGGSDKYRLPTEAEWEYACRAGTTTEFSFGDDPSRLGEYAWYRGNAEERTHPVAQKAANPWGLYDMHGNVVEWVEDDWHDDYKDAPDDGSAWIKNPRGSSRVLRGGAWLDPAEFCRSADRFRYDPVIRYHFFGFRLVCLPGQ